MTDYIFYKSSYFGTVIPNETAFNSVITEATAYVDSLILHKELIEYAEEAYNKAVCAVADNLYTYKAKQSTDTSGTTATFKGSVASESVGNHSISYATSAYDRASLTETKTVQDIEKEKSARMYLAHTGLLYGGMG